MEAGYQLFKDDETPLYIQAARAVRARILDGELRLGDRLPSVRGLSDELGVNPATVVAAYRILTREGFIVAKAGLGAFVAPDAPVDGAVGEPSAAFPASERPLADGSSGAVDLAANAPPLDMFPLVDMKRFIVEAIDADGGKAFEYQDTGGYRPLRVAMAERLAARGRPGSVDPFDVHIVSGAQQGIDLAARILLRPGDVAAVENPGYRGARDAFVAAGARVEPVPVDSGGLDLDALEALARSRPLRLVHVNPGFQNPTCVVYTAERRSALASMAERYGFYVLEDDQLAELSWDGSMPPAVRDFDEAGRVILVKSTSKCLMPGLRIAFLEAPTALRSRFEAVKRSIDISSNGLMQRALERFIASGRFDEHIAAARDRYRAAYGAFDAALAPCRSLGLSWAPPGGGLNLWLALPSGVSARSFASSCLAAGCVLAPEASFRHEAAEPERADSHLRVSFGSAPLESLSSAAMAMAAVARRL